MLLLVLMTLTPFFATAAVLTDRGQYEYDTFGFGGFQNAEPQQVADDTGVMADDSFVSEELPETQLNTETDVMVVPEMLNYDPDVAQPYCIMCAITAGVGGGALVSRKKPIRNGVKTINKITRNRKSVDDFAPEQSPVLGSEVELRLYSTAEDLQALYQSPVISADRVERPLASRVSTVVSEALGGKQSAVVAKLADGRQFLIVKGNQRGQGRRTVAILANHMTDDWIRTGSKTVTSSTLGDFVRAGGRTYNLVTDNGHHATSRMMALP